LPSKEPRQSLRDISEAIDLIEVGLGERAVAICPDQPWHAIRATGNWLRHAYERIDLETVWGTIKDDLPPLKAAVLRALAPHTTDPNGPLS
jgi:uncharacterized protein with HEPN domain